MPRIILGEKEWQSPSHKGGIRPPKIFDNIVSGILTDKQIDAYSRSGFYSNRRYYRKEARKILAIQNLFKPKEKRMVYNTSTQDFEEREI